WKLIVRPRSRTAPPREHALSRPENRRHLQSRAALARGRALRALASPRSLARSSVLRVLSPVSGDLRLVAVADRQQHFLRVVEIAALLAVVFENPRLDDRIDRAA